MAIPQQLVMKADLAALAEYDLQPVFSQLKSQTDCAFDERAVLVLLLLIERAKGSASKWATYINSLPQEYGA